MRKSTDVLLDPLVNILDRAGMRPNQVTVMSFIFCLIGAYTFLRYDHVLGVGTLILSVLFDSLDGALARKTNRITKYGNYLDAMVDKIVEGMIFLTFGAYNWPLAFAAGLTSVLVSYSKHRADLFNVKISGGFFQRPVRLGFVLISILMLEILALQNWAVWILAISAVLSSITIFQRMYLVKKALG